MKKMDEIIDPNSCLNKAHPDETLFILLARDRAAAVAIRAWIKERIRLGMNQPQDAKLIHAERAAASMIKESLSFGMTTNGGAQTGTLGTTQVFNLQPKAPSKRPDVAATIEANEKQYGPFKEHARITQSLKLAMYRTPNWVGLSDNKKEALEMVAHKLGRILAGDPEYHDSWHDMEGYIKLVADTLTKAT